MYICKTKHNIMEVNFLNKEVFEALLNNVVVCDGYEMEDVNEIPNVYYEAEAKGYRMIFNIENNELQIEEIVFKGEYIEDELNEAQTKALEAKAEEVLNEWVKDQQYNIGINESENKRKSDYSLWT